jgi:hypothetical protein
MLTKPPDLLLRPDEAARLLGIDLQAFQALAAAGVLPRPDRIGLHPLWSAHGLIDWALAQAPTPRSRKQAACALPVPLP